MTHIATEWKVMTDKAKEKYHKLATEDKARYEKETNQMQTVGYFINSKGESSKKMLPELKAFPKTTVMPKHAHSAYTEFMIHSQEQIKSKFPALGLGDVMKKKAELWSAMTENDKKPYVALAEQDRKRFD